METKANNKQRDLKRLVSAYNLLLNLCWSALSFVPLCVFCFEWVESSVLILFGGVSLLPGFLSHAALDNLRLFKSTKTYQKLGVSIVQHVSQNGVFVNYLVRKRHPGHRVVRTERKSIEGLMKQTYVFETFHLVCLLFFCMTIILAFFKGLLAWVVLLTLINLCYNVYPILLQQYIRLKLAGYNRKQSTKAAAGSKHFGRYRLKCIE